MPYTLKRGVALVMTAEIEKMVNVIAPIYESFGLPFVITSGVDGPHRPDSLHYQFRAIDARKHFSDQVMNDIWKHNGKVILIHIRNQCRLNGLPVDVVEETDHIHYEYDDRHRERA